MFHGSHTPARVPGGRGLMERSVQGCQHLRRHDSVRFQLAIDQEAFQGLLRKALHVPNVGADQLRLPACRPP